jgi:hypothetical protein
VVFVSSVPDIETWSAVENRIAYYNLLHAEVNMIIFQTNGLRKLDDEQPTGKNLIQKYNTQQLS